MNNNQKKILIALLSNRIIIKPGYSWRIQNRRIGDPSLNNNDTSALFRGDLISEQTTNETTYMTLTISGKLEAARQAKKIDIVNT
jgi:hypothetical protein